MAGLLAGDATRSEHDPDLTLAPRHDAHVAMHTVMGTSAGTFADPSLEVASQRSSSAQPIKDIYS